MSDFQGQEPGAEIVPFEAARGSIMRKKPAPMASWVDALRWAEAAVTAVERPVIQAGAPVEAIPQLNVASVTLGELMQTRFPPPDWLVRGLIERGKLAAIIGAPKSAKTWFAQEVALSVAAGLPVCEFPDFDGRQRAAKVYLWCVEDHKPDVQRRLVSLWEGRDTMPHDLENVKDNLRILAGQRIDLMTREQFLQAVATIRHDQGRPDLIVMDPFVDLVEFENENDAKQMSMAMERFRIIRDVFQCAVLLVHHAKKKGDGDKGKDVNAARGSNAFMGKLDAWVIMDGVEAADDGSSIAADFRVTLKNGRRVPPLRVELRIEDSTEGYARRATWVLERKVTLHKETQATLEARILEHLGKAGMSGQDAIAAALASPRANTRKAIGDLETAGKIVLVRRGPRGQGYCLPDAQFP